MQFGYQALEESQQTDPTKRASKTWGGEKRATKVHDRNHGQKKIATAVAACELPVVIQSSHVAWAGTETTCSPYSSSLLNR